MEKGEKVPEVNKEIEEMLNALGNPTPENLKGRDDVEDDKGDDKDKDKDQEDLDKDKSDDKSDDKDKGDDKEDPDKDKDKDKDDKSEDENQDDEEADKDKVIENLRKQLDEKSGKPDKEEAAPEKKEDKKVEPLKLEDQDFIGGLDVEEVVRDKDAFNKLLNSVYAKGVNDSKNITVDGVLSNIPDIVKHNLTLLTTLKETSDKFYKENEDLASFKRVVAAVFEDIAAKNPDKKYNELMNLVAPEARKRLGLGKQVAGKGKGNGDEGGKHPRLPGAKHNQRHNPSHKNNPSALESEISEMNKVIGR
jgi:hypothetical protein